MMGPRWWLRRLTVCRRGYVFRVGHIDECGVCHGADANGVRRQTRRPRSPTPAEREAYTLEVERNVVARIGPVVDATVKRLQVLAESESEVAVHGFPMATRSDVAL